ncbi:MAG TPA: hypothetical protein PLU99_04795 [Phycisphaerae bacterium]|nr:hypothetical protein [Phycisphaerae bacterium]
MPKLAPPLLPPPVNVLFVEGCVHFTPREAFEQALAGTYSRLGREAEMPGELGGGGLPGE